MSGTRAARPAVERCPPARFLAHAREVAQVYEEAFGAPPWSHPAEKLAAFPPRLPADAARPGFAGALAWQAGGLAGFAYGFTTPEPFPSERLYGPIQRLLGPERVRAELAGAFEVHELAVRPAAQGRGLGRELLAALLAAVPAARAWLVTAAVATRAVRLYRATGWRQLAEGWAPRGRFLVFTLDLGAPR